MPGFDGCWVKLDMAAERRRSEKRHRASSMGMSNIEHRAQSTERRAKKRK